MEGNDIDDVFFPAKTCKQHLHGLTTIVKITIKKNSVFPNTQTKMTNFIE